jgi:hypothetical protein
MANPDRPNGFIPVGTLDGSPWNARVRRYEAADRTADTTNNHGDIYVGDPVALSSGKVIPANSAAAVVGVVVAVGKEASVNNGVGPYNPENLSTRYAPLTDATGWYVWVCPSVGTIFEVQSASDLDLAVGSPADINLVAATAHGSRTTGLSDVELTTASDNDVYVVELKNSEDNDTTLANARYLVSFREIAFAQAAT